MKTLNLDQLSFDENIEFNVIASEIRNDYDALVNQLSQEYLTNIHWIVCSIASRNKYQSALFYRCCQIVFVQKKITDNNQINKIHLSDRPLADLLSKNITTSISVECTESFVERLWRYFRPIRQIIIAFFLLFLRFMGSINTKPRNFNRDESLILVDTFVLNNKAGDEGSIKNGTYKDRYYPGLLENLSEEEKKQIYFVPTIIGFLNPIKIFKKIREANFSFILHDDFLKMGDYLFAMSQPFKMMRIEIKKTLFSKIDIEPILTQEKKRNCSDFVSILGLLYYRFAFRLKKNNIKIKLLVEWYENQAIDRGMIVGFHTFLPTTTIIGYQGYIISKSLHLYTQPNNSEFDSMAVPDFIAVPGKGLINDIREFCSRVNVIVGPAFRFQNLWRERKSHPPADKYNVLIGLPIDLGDSKNILELLINDQKLVHCQNINFLIKPHPTWPSEVICGLFPKGYLDAFDFVLGDFHNALEKSSLVITNASSIALEAVAKGVPVIIVAPKTGVLQNPIPEKVNKDCWSICYSTSDIKNEILNFKLMKKNRFNFMKIGNKVRSDYFQEVTRDSVQNFVRVSKLR